MTDVDRDDSNVRENLLKLFNEVRESPNTEFIPDRFLDFLIDNSGNEQSVHNSFRGKRLFWKFIRRVEITFAICFANKDLDSPIGMDEMVHRIIYLQQTPKVSRSAITRRLREPLALPLIILLLVIPIFLVSIAYQPFSHGALLILVLPIFLVAFIIGFHFREKRYYKNLRARIDQAKHATNQ